MKTRKQNPNAPPYSPNIIGHIVDVVCVCVCVYIIPYLLIEWFSCKCVIYFRHLIRFLIFIHLARSFISMMMVTSAITVHILTEKQTINTYSLLVNSYRSKSQINSNKTEILARTHALTGESAHDFLHLLRSLTRSINVFANEKIVKWPKRGWRAHYR